METTPTRRKTLKILTGLTWTGLVGAVGLGMGAVFRLATGQDPPAPAAVDFGPSPELPPGGVSLRGQVALCRDEGGWFALQVICPHLGCKPGWRASCRWRGSTP